MQLLYSSGRWKSWQLFPVPDFGDDNQVNFSEQLKQCWEGSDVGGVGGGRGGRW